MISLKSARGNYARAKWADFSCAPMIKSTETRTMEIGPIYRLRCSHNCSADSDEEQDWEQRSQHPL